MNDQDHGEAQKILYNSYEKSVLGVKKGERISKPTSFF